SDKEREFLAGAIAGLSGEGDEGRVAPVRLALFAQMLSEEEWSPSTLQKVGGAEGVGVAFLEETFDTERGRRRFQLGPTDLKLSCSILKALLPSVGTGIKGGIKSEEELLRVSECEGDRDRFRRLIRILDSETRLITPTDATEVVNESLPGQPGPADRRYQL